MFQFHKHSVEVNSKTGEYKTLNTLDAAALLNFAKFYDGQQQNLMCNNNNASQLIKVRNFIAHAALDDLTNENYEICFDIFVKVIGNISKKIPKANDLLNKKYLEKLSGQFEAQLTKDGGNNVVKDKIVEFIKASYEGESTTHEKPDYSSIREKSGSLITLYNVLDSFAEYPQEIEEMVEKVWKQLFSKRRKPIKKVKQCIEAMIDNIKRSLDKDQNKRKNNDSANDLLAANNTLADFKNALNLLIFSTWTTSMNILNSKKFHKLKINCNDDYIIEPVGTKKKNLTKGGKKNPVNKKNTV